MPTDSPILYSFRRCPYAIRARMALAISEADYQHREVLLRDKPQAMLDASPKGTVPVLVLPGGKVIDESIDVMRWALAQNDPESWLAGDDADLVATNDGEFKHHLDRYKYSTRHNSDPEEHRSACLGILKHLEERLSHGEWLCGNDRKLTDAALMPFIRQFANTDRDWFDRQDLPRLQDWLERQLASSLFAQVMVKHDRWVPEPSHD